MTDYTIREALHNAIAHQDYTLQQRINFVENPDFLYYANGGVHPWHVAKSISN